MLQVELTPCHFQVCQIWHPNWVILAPNERNLRLFKISFSIFCSPIQNILKLILKSPRFVTFGANLTQFGCQIRQPWLTPGGAMSRVTDWSQMGKSGDFLDHIPYILAHQSEKKMPVLSNFRPIWPILGPNLVVLIQVMNISRNNRRKPADWGNK